MFQSCRARANVECELNARIVDGQQDEISSEIDISGGKQQHVGLVGLQRFGSKLEFQIQPEENTCSDYWCLEMSSSIEVWSMDLNLFLTMISSCAEWTLTLLLMVVAERACAQATLVRCAIVLA